jgi:acyl carrier protein
MNESPLLADLNALMSSVLGIIVTEETVRKTEPAWDSLKHMEIIFAVEGKWGVTFSEEEIVLIGSVADLLRKLQTHNAS